MRMDEGWTPQFFQYNLLFIFPSSFDQQLLLLILGAFFQAIRWSRHFQRHLLQKLYNEDWMKWKNPIIRAFSWRENIFQSLFLVTFRATRNSLFQALSQYHWRRGKDHRSKRQTAVKVFRETTFFPLPFFGRPLFAYYKSPRAWYRSD